MHGQRGFYGRGIGLFVLGVVVGGLAMGGLHSHSKEVAFEDEGLDTTEGMDEVMPTSFSVMDRNGCVCRSCEEALAVAHDRLVGLEDRIESCEKEATAREEEEFRRQDGLREDDTTENKEEEEEEGGSSSNVHDVTRSDSMKMMKKKKKKKKKGGIQRGGKEKEEEVYEFAAEPIEVFVGIQSGVTSSGMEKTDYDYADRRSTIRHTWLRTKDAAFQKKLADHGIVVKFVMGHALDEASEEALVRESRMHGDLLRLDLSETYANLAEKSHAFFKVVMSLYDPTYIVKVDDDVYFKLSRLPSIVQHWTSIGADYIGCMKTGEIQMDPKFKWFEPQHTLLGDASYFAHTWGSVYVLSGAAAQAMLEINKEHLRFFANEDVTVGAWMLALDMKHYDDRRLCLSACGHAGVAVMDMPHPGLKHVHKRMLELDSTPECREDDFDQDIQVIMPFMNFP
ncbi:hypothetical protein M9434_005862 [Picochlorum sp. BPE23]|nr:hypothetical protein M9434_005862 [Picochlorum sp. BPE23]